MTITTTDEGPLKFGVEPPSPTRDRWGETIKSIDQAASPGEWNRYLADDPKAARSFARALRVVSSHEWQTKIRGSAVYFRLKEATDG